MGARAASRTGVQHPRQTLAVRHHAVAMAINDDPRLGIASAQAFMTASGGHAVTVLHHQEPAWQLDLGALGNPLKQRLLLGRPFAVDIIVAAHRIHLPQARLQAGQHGNRADIPAMHGDVAVRHQRQHARVDLAMGIGEQGHPQLLWGAPP